MVPTNAPDDQQRVAQLAGPSTACRPRAVPDASIFTPSNPSVRHRPTPSKFSSARPIGSMILWQPAQAGFARCCSIRSRTEAPARRSASP